MNRSVDWETLARANTHPLRISILEVLAIDDGRTLSPKDLSIELQAPLSTVNYHVTELARSGLIELRRERQVRGAVEHFYSPTPNGRRPAAGNGSLPEAADVPLPEAADVPLLEARTEEAVRRTTGLEPAYLP